MGFKYTGQNSILVFSYTGLSHINDVVQFVICAKKEIDTALFKMRNIFTFIYGCSRNFVGNACPII